MIYKKCRFLIVYNYFAQLVSQSSSLANGYFASLIQLQNTKYLNLPLEIWPKLFGYTRYVNYRKIGLAKGFL